jgi:hypothetical protein
VARLTHGIEPASLLMRSCNKCTQIVRESYRTISVAGATRVVHLYMYPGLHLMPLTTPSRVL